MLRRSLKIGGMLDGRNGAISIRGHILRKEVVKGHEVAL